MPAGRHGLLIGGKLGKESIWSRVLTTLHLEGGRLAPTWRLRYHVITRLRGSIILIEALLAGVARPSPSTLYPTAGDLATVPLFVNDILDCQSIRMPAMAHTAVRTRVERLGGGLGGLSDYGRM